MVATGLCAPETASGSSRGRQQPRSTGRALDVFGTKEMGSEDVCDTVVCVRMYGGSVANGEIRAAMGLKGTGRGNGARRRSRRRDSRQTPARRTRNSVVDEEEGPQQQIDE